MDFLGKSCCGKLLLTNVVKKMSPTTFICYFAWVSKVSLMNVWKQRGS